MDDTKLELRLLEANASTPSLRDLVNSARAKGFSAVTVFSSRVLEVAHWLEDSGVQVCAAVGFPGGETDPDVKRYEVEVACDNGAQQIEYAPFLPPLMEGDHRRLLRELNDAVEASEERPFFLSIPLDHIDDGQISILAALSEEAKVSGILLPDVRRVEQVQKAVGKLKIKAVVDNVEQIRALSLHGIAHFSVQPAVLSAL